MSFSLGEDCNRSIWARNQSAAAGDTRATTQPLKSSAGVRLGEVMAHLCADTPGPASRRSCRPGCLETLCLARRGCPANTLDAAALGRRGSGFEQNGAPPVRTQRAAAAIK